MKRRSLTVSSTIALSLLALVAGCSTKGAPTASTDSTEQATNAPAVEEDSLAAPKKGRKADDSRDAEAGSGEGVAAKDETRPSRPRSMASSSPRAAAPPSPMPAGGKFGSSLKRRDHGRRPTPVRTPDAAGVKAGEWDDNANYQAFTKYLSSQHFPDFQKLDLSHRRFIVVRDENGRAVPNCAVRISDGSISTELTTTASGRALLFPRAMGFSSAPLTATANCEGSQVSASFTTASADAAIQLNLQSARSLPQTRTVDLAFILDTTGSMSEEITAVKATIQKVAAQLAGSNTKVRVGLVEYKDRGEEIHTRTFNFTSDLGAFQKRINDVRASGGGDHAEDAIAGVRDGLNKLQWSDNSVARMAFVIGDAPPHLDYGQSSDYVPHLRAASKRGIKLYTVAASGMDDLGQAVWAADGAVHRRHQPVRETRRRGPPVVRRRRPERCLRRHSHQLHQR